MVPDIVDRFQRSEADHYRLVTNLFLFHLQRHSDHHANPARRVSSRILPEGEDENWRQAASRRSGSLTGSPDWRVDRARSGHAGLRAVGPVCPLPSSGVGTPGSVGGAAPPVPTRQRVRVMPA
ncbi:hypothetical protein C5E44_06535 [Nocardia nova]|nr:hypothetical protein C5E44_06535 [Nocardia nova]